MRIFGPGWPTERSVLRREPDGLRLRPIAHARDHGAAAERVSGAVSFPHRLRQRAIAVVPDSEPASCRRAFPSIVVFGELVKVDADKHERAVPHRPHRGVGRLLAAFPKARSGISMRMPGCRTCRWGLVAASLSIRIGSGAFTRASLVSDEFSYLAGNAVTYRVEVAQARRRQAARRPANPRSEELQRRHGTAARHRPHGTAGRRRHSRLERRSAGED